MVRLRNVLEKYIKNDQMFEMIEYFKDNNIQYLYPNKKYCFLLDIKNKNMLGGDKYTLDLKINKIKYMVNIDEYSDMIYTQLNEKPMINNKEYKKIDINNIKMTNDHNNKTISFIKFNAIKDERGDYKENNHCAVLIIDFVKKKSIIQSLNNYTDCVRCLTNENFFFRTGDILTQIMIIMSIKNKLKYIELTDNSYLLCKNSKISLIHLRTMTKGTPFYSKYGFIPVYEKRIYDHNFKNYNKHKTLTKEKIIKYLYFKEFDKNEDIKMLNYIQNILIPRLKPINLVSEFINSIIDDKNKVSCSLLYNIYMKIYEDIGYYKYERRKFILDLKNIKI